MLPSCPLACAGLQGVHRIRRPRATYAILGHPLVGLRAPSETSSFQRPVDHRLPRGQTVQPNRLPSLRFSAPTASPRPRQQHDGLVCLARPLASSGFLNLSTPSSAASLPALFHAGSAHGVVPFRALLLPCSRSPSLAPFPSCRCANLRSEPSARHRAPKRLPPYRTGHSDRPSSCRSSPPVEHPPTAEAIFGPASLSAAEATF
jgi:hypothetical protein